MGYDGFDILSIARKMKEQDYLARGKLIWRIRSSFFLIPAWFAPHSKLRVFFHRLRGIKIGKNVEIGYFCIIGHVHPYLITIEDGAVITVGSVILEHDNSYFYSRGKQVKHGPVIIKERAFIGAHSIIMPDVTVGDGAIVGANSVVIKNVSSGSVVAGIPAKVIEKND